VSRHVSEPTKEPELIVDFDRLRAELEEILVGNLFRMSYRWSLCGATLSGPFR